MLMAIQVLLWLCCRLLTLHFGKKISCLYTVCPNEKVPLAYCIRKLLAPFFWVHPVALHITVHILRILLTYFNQTSVDRLNIYFSETRK